ncbi:MAG: NADH-quinone oxidoreductase subunit C, partial [Cyclobacteriaceae bacterium]
MESSKTDAIISIIRQEFESEIVHIEQPYDLLTITFKPERIIDIIQLLYSHNELQFQFLTTLCGIHYPDQNQIAVMYQLHNLRTNHRIRLKIFLPADQPQVATLTGIFSAANWMERETY